MQLGNVLNISLKLYLYDKSNPTNILKIRILSQTSIFYLICHASVILIVGLGILVWDKILIFSLFVGCFYRKGPA